MRFNVNLSKRNTEHYYLPGQEIRISRGILSKKSILLNNDSLSVCRNRIGLSLLVFITLYSLLAIRVSYVCLKNGVNFDTAISEKIVDNENAIEINIPVKRADILDRNGEIIATSLPTVNLYTNPRLIKNPEDTASQLNNIFPELDYESLKEKLSSKRRFVYIKRNLSPTQQAAVNALGIPMLEFEEGEKRIYPHNNLFSHILGHTNIDNKGIAGLEKFLDERLTNSTKAVQLSVDIGIQNTIREELIAGVEKYKASRASAILMDVNNGNIIALSTYPDYNPNSSINTNSEEAFNFATNGVYEAGSVFKVFNTALCIDSGKVDINEKFDTAKPIYFGRHSVRDPHGSHKKLTPEDILVESSNIGSTLEIMKVGKEEQRAFLQKINMNKALSDLELSEKATPLFLDEKRWSDHLMATVSYGYGISATPLHIITAFSSIVNGGNYYNPTLIYDNQTSPTKVISEQTSKKMRKMLRAVVERGTAKQANIIGYEVMGKTGSANKIVNGKYDNKQAFSTFISGFPASNPKYALLIVLDNPQGIKETHGFTTAGWNAVPIAGNIISSVAPQLNIKADFDLETQKNIVNAAYQNIKH